MECDSCFNYSVYKEGRQWKKRREERRRKKAIRSGKREREVLVAQAEEKEAEATIAFRRKDLS